jgi:hypothetical protein
MIITSVLVIVALLALVFLIRLAKGHGFGFRHIEDPRGQIRPVDVEAFRNLIDPGEEAFLRENLSAAEFRAIQRERLRAAVEYIACAAHNAAILVRVGELARRSPNPSIAEAGEKLLDSAIRLRLYAVQATAKLYLGIVFPAVRISAVGLPENYERMTRQVFLLGRLQSSDGAAITT